jgi:hypothetical protein
MRREERAMSKEEKEREDDEMDVPSQDEKSEMDA